MENLLYLVHRIPFPPNKGDKIRSFNWLKGLSEHYHIYLGTFIDDPDDEKYVSVVKDYTVDTKICRINPKLAKVRSLSALLTGGPLTNPYYFDSEMQSWVVETVKKQRISRVLVFSSSMAQYVISLLGSDAQIVVDFVDVDSDKWQQYANRKSWPMSYVYSREAKTLFAFEKEIAKQVNASTFVSEKEVESFIAQSGLENQNILPLWNGVDTEYFSPSAQLESLGEKTGPVITFTGAMDYWANVDSVVWFAKNVFGKLKSEFSDLRFYIVGSNPNPEVCTLSAIEGIEVTGKVKDIRPYIASADLVVAPMTIARGIQNKVLEAMAMGKVVVTSPQGFEGLDAVPGDELLVADGADKTIAMIRENLLNRNTQMEERARACMVEKYSWKSSVDQLLTLLNSNSK
ncbi:MAG: TIGR03087 family PEP-CTERM/XrtA system glycosyltransferase [Gammaproteobacteria bacterium]|nr:TIGR03087 family PEP-CTERM/XrtA system glycosyltransferase [Gammaproteobacteria bacterium]MDH5691586.1 TIGR03087 family PEP-CTERM/XrtA system glycosyltransferase [Gammaproteobacteria bacterium]